MSFRDLRPSFTKMVANWYIGQRDEEDIFDIDIEIHEGTGLVPRSIQ
jgi:hypothetical protein